MDPENLRRKIEARSQALAQGVAPAPPMLNDATLSGGDVGAVTTRPAAVLMPVVLRESGLTMLLTQRTEDMPSHAGQVAFPGGRVQPEDADAIDTALRETEEEIGLARGHVDVIGTLDRYVTGTGFLITPVVGLVTPPFVITPDPREVADVFEVPLQFLLDVANHQIHARQYNGRERRFYAMPYENRYIWGATAGMLRNLWFALSETP
jgi:8-oxo-dGTP pyrophosphatase MutT (NUDIX family)